VFGVRLGDASKALNTTCAKRKVCGQVAAPLESDTFGNDWSRTRSEAVGCGARSPSVLNLNGCGRVAQLVEQCPFKRLL
jgi:hypothetical protein